MGLLVAIAGNNYSLVATTDEFRVLESSSQFIAGEMVEAICRRKM